MLSFFAPTKFSLTLFAMNLEWVIIAPGGIKDGPDT